MRSFVSLSVRLCRFKLSPLTRLSQVWNQNALFQFVQSGERSVARIAVKKRLHLTLIEVVTRTLCILYVTIAYLHNINGCRPNHKVRLKNQTSAIVDMCWNDTMSAELEADILSKLRGDNQKIHHPIFESIAYLEWADKLQVRLLAALDRMLADHLESFVNNFESPCLPTILSWFQLNVLPKTSSILGGIYSFLLLTCPYVCVDELSAEFLSKAIDTVNIAFCKMRIKSSFDMIVEYPSSEPAFDELTGIFNFGSTMRSDFSRHLMSEIKRRLLRPAAKTGDIIHFYISTISALTKLDNHGHLVHFVTEPICNYLRTRDDTVRCIIHSLFDDPDLEADLKRPDLITINEDLTDDEWEPAPMDLPLTKFHKNSDILSALVNIYDSKDVFVKEFQLFLSTRLLNVKNFDYQDEFGYVELLKIRFGDCLHASEVMLRDMLESSRLDQTIKSSTKDQSVVHAIIVSHLFWPTLKTSPIAYPANMARYLEAFEKEYQKVKRSRNLKWIPELGSVDLEITTGDGNTIAVTVSPLHAAVVSLFENDTQLEFNEMAKKLKMSAEAVISKVAYWINLGVLTKDGNVVRRGGRKNSRGTFLMKSKRGTHRIIIRWIRRG
eukprot:Partr_v1_DN27729_c0_g1_i2_m67303 putative complex subunit